MKGIKNIRLKNYDYSTSGYYFVTISANRQKSILEKHRKIISDAIGKIGQIKGAKFDYYMIMPNHIHFIIALESCRLRLGEIIRRFKSIVTKELGFKVWQPNYYEHVIRNEEALGKIREYIQNNPLVKKIEFGDFY